MWVGPTVSGRPAGVPWEGRGQDAKEPRIPCRKEARQTGEPSREEVEGAPGGGGLGTLFRLRSMAFLRWEEPSITGCLGRGWVL